VNTHAASRIALIAVLFADITLAAELPSYRLKEIPELVPPNFSDESINNRGEIAGSMLTPSGVHAAKYSNGKVTDLGTLGGPTSGGEGINARGDVVGISRVEDPDLPGVFGWHAFFFSDGLMEDLGAIGRFSGAAAINNRGTVVGTADVSREFDESQAFIHRNGATKLLPFTSVNAINERGQIAGFHRQLGGVIYWRRKLRVIPHFGGGFIQIAAINNRGQFCGTSANAANELVLFFHDGKRMHLLPSLAVEQQVHGINERGDITAHTAREGDFLPVAGWLYRDGRWHNVNDLLSPRDPLTPFVTIVEARSLNDPGQIVAVGVDSRTNLASTYLLTPERRGHRSR
jgi:probable HAF family extracellular repeat protein